MKESEKSLDPQLWKACAGSMVQIPSVNAKVYYFPQGHLEHAQSPVDLSSSPPIPPLIPCRVGGIKFLADSETDEVYAKINLIPFSGNELDFEDDLEGNGSDNPEKPASFAKTLTQSDANNGGGFSVPRYCAETIFPKLDYAADPPVQTVVVKDIHGETWKFRHIYRGTPRRHLLTTGWSTFVNQKKLIAGDSIVFLRAENGDLCVGIRRAKRGNNGIGNGNGPDSGPSSGWGSGYGTYSSPFGGFSAFLRGEEESKMTTVKNLNSNGNFRKVGPDSVSESMNLAANGKPFEVVYYPRGSTPEFCVKTSSVRAALRIEWVSGMRFKMPFETEDSSRISWFMGTVSAVQVADPIRWPNSPWRLLQVAWDEPDLLQNVKRVSPWLVEIASNMPAIHLSPFSPPRKKFRLPQPLDFPLDGKFHAPFFSGNPLGPPPPSSPMCFLSDNPPATAAAGIQGARHAQFGISLSDLQLNNKLHTGLFMSNFDPRFNPNSRISNTIVNKHTKTTTTTVNTNNENLSCLLTIGNSSQTLERPDRRVKTRKFLLFGQPIVTEQQLICSGDTEEEEVIGLRSSDSSNKSRTPGFSWRGGFRAAAELPLDTSHCKVFMESEDVGRTLDLSVLGSYAELYGKLGNMFETENSEMFNRVLYRDATGAVKQIGDEPFSDFTKTAKRLTIVMPLRNDNVGKTWITSLRNGAENGLDAQGRTGALSIFP